MKTMKKLFAFLLSAAMCCTVLAACSNSSAGNNAGSGNSADTSGSDSGWTPSGPVTIICPYGAGGGQDVAARMLAKYAEKYAGVKFVVDNRTGGSGTIGNTAIANAKPDGMTLGMYHNLSNFDQFLVDGVTYTEESFIQLCCFTSDATVIVANKSLGVTDLAGLVELAKAEPGKITWGGPEYSSQTYPRMNVENATGASFGKMIFDGGAASLTAVAGGNCDVTSVFPSEYAAMSDNPDIIVLATTGEERMAALPDVPTMKEQGIDATFHQIRSFVLPAGASDEIIAFYDNVFTQTMADPEFQEELTNGGFEFVDMHDSASATEYMIDDFNSLRDSIVAEAEATKSAQ